MNPSFWKLKAVLLTVIPMLTACAVATDGNPLPVWARFVAGILAAGCTPLLSYLMKSPESQREQNETENRSNR